MGSEEQKLFQTENNVHVNQFYFDNENKINKGIECSCAQYCCLKRYKSAKSATSWVRLAPSSEAMDS